MRMAFLKLATEQNLDGAEREGGNGLHLLRAQRDLLDLCDARRLMHR